MEKRITPENITSDLPKDVMFVFGSNESGIHGAGAAKFAYEQCGAWLGQGFGPMNQSFAIPTKDWEIHSLPLSVVATYVDRFIEYTRIKHRVKHEWKFYVTRIGCGLAGFKVEDIAPLFKSVRNQENIWLPQDFIDVIDSLPEEEVSEKIEEMYEKDTSA